MSEQTWSKHWQRSTNPGKQRKYRANAPYHQRSQFLSARVDESVRDRVDTKTMPIREGDRVKVQRGDYKGKTGEVREIDYDSYKIYIEGVKRNTVSGSETTAPIDPSNVVITKLNLDDDMRVEKYDLSAADRDAISVDEADEPEDAAEESEDEDEGGAASSEEPEEDEEDTAAGDDSSAVDYEALVEENVKDVKARVRDEELDPAKALEAEKNNKNRSTLVDWLENRTEDDE